MCEAGHREGQSHGDRVLSCSVMGQRVLETWETYFTLSPLSLLFTLIWTRSHLACFSAWKTNWMRLFQNAFSSCCCKGLKTFSSAALLPLAICLQRWAASPKLLYSFIDWMLLKALVPLHLLPFSYENKLQYNQHCIWEICRRCGEGYSALHIQTWLKRWNVSAYTTFYR